MPNRRATPKFPDESVKTPSRGALLRGDLAPDYPGIDCNPTPPTTNSVKQANGESGTYEEKRLLDPISELPDNKRTSPRSGPSGP